VSRGGRGARQGVRVGVQARDQVCRGEKFAYLESGKQEIIPSVWMVMTSTACEMGVVAVT